MIVEATGVAVGLRGGEDAAKRIEAVMIAAVENAAVDGITDPDKVRELMLVARDTHMEADNG